MKKLLLAMLMCGAAYGQAVSPGGGGTSSTGTVFAGDTGATPTTSRYITSTNSGLTAGIPVGFGCWVQTYYNSGETAPNNYDQNALCIVGYGPFYTYFSIGTTLTAPSFGLGIAFSNNNIITTGTIQAPIYKTGTSSNTDSAGSLTLVAGTKSYTFTGSYTNAPICTASDDTAIAAVKVTVTATTLTVTGTSTDVVSYICMVRN